MFKLKKISALLIVFICACNEPQKTNIVLTGKVDLLSNSKEIKIKSPTDEFVIPIKSDGSFELKTFLTNAGAAKVWIENTGADAIWLEPGKYNINFKEITIDGSKKYYLRTPVLKGPQDAEILNFFNQSTYNIKGNNINETLAKHKQFTINYIDSILEVFPQSKVIPDIVQLAEGILGDDMVKNYRAKFSAAQKNETSSKRIDNDIKRNDILAEGKQLEDFAMKTDKGADFKLSSLATKKYILIDFWASWCSPCRVKHPALLNLYAKYAKQGFEIVSISLDSDRQKWEKAIFEDKMNWINVSDLTGFETAMAKRYLIESIPYSILLNGDRKIIGINISFEKLEDLIK